MILMKTWEFFLPKNFFDKLWQNMLTSNQSFGHNLIVRTELWLFNELPVDGPKWYINDAAELQDKWLANKEQRRGLKK